MKTAIKVSENTLWQIAGRAINSLSGLLIIAVIARTYGDSGVGIYTLILGYISFFFMPVDFGLNAIAVKHLFDKQKQPTTIIKSLLGLRLLIAISVVALALTVSLLLPYNTSSQQGYPPTAKAGIAIVSFAIISQAFLATANALFQARQKYIYTFLTNLASAATFTTGLLLLAATHQSLIIALTAYTMSALVSSAVSMIFIHKELKTSKPQWKLTYYKELLIETAPLTITILLNLIYFRIDSLILPFFRPIEEVGYYNTAYKVFEAALVIPNYFSNALYPVLLEQYQKSKSQFLITIQKSALALTAVSITISAAAYIAAPYIVQILSKNPNHATIEYIRILTSGLIFFFLSSIAMWTLIIINKQKALSWIYSLTMVLNILLNCIFIPRYGAHASAIITITTEALVLAMSGYVVSTNIQKKV